MPPYLTTPNDNGRQFFLQVDYDPQNAVGIGSTTITGNAPNEPFNSVIATITVPPLVEITTQPVVTSTFPDVETDISVVASLSDTSFADDTQYQWQLDSSDVSNGVITKNGVDTVVAGATTPTLTLTSNNFGIGYVARCRVSSATASNSPIVSDSQIYTVNVPSNVINIEAITNAGNQAVLSSVDLDNGDIILNAATSSTASDVFLYSLYAPNKDVDVEMDLYGGQGLVGNGSGGAGGYSRIRFTMKKNEEYVIAGLTDLINAPFVYRKATLIACVGQGGGGGSVSVGGKGGGINVSTGESGFGRDGGMAAVAIPNGQLTERGVFGSVYPSADLRYFGDTIATGIGAGGRALTCSQGIYWSDQGIGACSDMSGDQQFRLSDGTLVTNTAAITRGFKAGYKIMQTAGKATGFKGARGGNGATGGVGGTNDITWEGKRFGLEKLTYNGKTTFEMLSVKIKSNGFEIEFTEPNRLGDGISPSDYLVQQWWYDLDSEGGVKQDLQTLDIESLSISTDRKKVFLQINNLSQSDHKGFDVVYILSLIHI